MHRKEVVNMDFGLVIFGGAVAAFEWFASHRGTDTRDGDDWQVHETGQR